MLIHNIVFFAHTHSYVHKHSCNIVQLYSFPFTKSHIGGDTINAIKLINYEMCIKIMNSYEFFVYALLCLSAGSQISDASSAIAAWCSVVGSLDTKRSKWWYEMRGVLGWDVWTNDQSIDRSVDWTFGKPTNGWTNTEMSTHFVYCIEMKWIINRMVVLQPKKSSFL